MRDGDGPGVVAAALVSRVARARHRALLLIHLQVLARQLLNTSALLAILGRGEGVVARETEGLAVSVGEESRGREDERFGTEGLVAVVGCGGGGSRGKSENGDVLHFVLSIVQRSD